MKPSLSQNANTIPLPVGQSVEQRPIELYVFGDTPDNQIDTLILGVFHGDEPIAGDVCYKLIEHLKIHSTKHSVGIVPVLNPDGLAKEQRQNANMVDLNRNYPTKDWKEADKDTIYYSGRAAASEPETQVVINLMELHQPKKIITVHAPYKVINYDGPALSLAQSMAAHSGYLVTEDIGYATLGSFGTYAGKERNIPVITLELPEDEPLEAVWKDNQQALIAAIEFQG